MKFSHYLCKFLFNSIQPRFKFYQFHHQETKRFAYKKYIYTGTVREVTTKKQITDKIYEHNIKKRMGMFVT